MITVDDRSAKSWKAGPPMIQTEAERGVSELACSVNIP